MLRAACLALMLGATAASAEGVVGAAFDEPTRRYAHGILGDYIEWGALVMETSAGRVLRVRLPDTRVFEDVAPRVVDVDGDGEGDVLVVETDVNRGARISIYGPEGLKASNDFIGSPNRWLSPIGVGAADLDGDGAMEIAYVDRPHLAKTLRVFRYRVGTLQHLADLPGVTNHRIGERDIAGGLRDCGQGPEMIVASADWTRVLAVRFDGKGFATRDLGPHRSRQSFAAAMAC